MDRKCTEDEVVIMVRMPKVVKDFYKDKARKNIRYLYQEIVKTLIECMENYDADISGKKCDKIAA